ncbi:MAG TPA: hypothetical protein VG871_05100 [Vicinamibacterales bacterium]|nr:hypothetical protein [Vicinamibacterales bacterium]
MVLAHQFNSEGHVVRLAVEETSTGWDVREELDTRLVHIQHFDDWHRVERSMKLLELDVIRHGYAAIATHH